MFWIEKNGQCEKTGGKNRRTGEKNNIVCRKKLQAERKHSETKRMNFQSDVYYR